MADNLYGDAPHASLSEIHEQVAALEVDDLRWAISHSVREGFIVNLAVPRLIQVDYDGYDSDDDFDHAAVEEGGKAAAVSDDACDIVTVYVRDMALLPDVMAEVGSTQTLKFAAAYRYAPNKDDLLPITA
ncbi:hypothetical protein ACOI1H_14680 [Loktanella sp. DJP18]|uniref:hypothetical protein n=1 Tax=Loktanella sp. DJP18 TaxID=3409788 RepID=UPI003BB57D74